MSALPGAPPRPLNDPPAYAPISVEESLRLRQLAETLSQAARTVNVAIGRGALTTTALESISAGTDRALSAAGDLRDVLASLSPSKP